MICEKCNSELHYGDKYCNTCGEKIDKSAFENEYNKTIWGRIDKVNDWYDTLFLKKITDSWIFKIIVLLAIIAWGALDAYTNYTSIKILESDVYTVEYNKKLDEYYIRTSEAEINLNLYIPGHTEKINITEYADEKEANEKTMTPEEYKTEAITVKKGDFDYITVDSLYKEKTTDTVKLYVMD